MNFSGEKKVKVRNLFTLLFVLFILLTLTHSIDAQKNKKNVNSKNTKAANLKSLTAEQFIYVERFLKLSESINEGYSLYISGYSRGNEFYDKTSELFNLKKVNLFEPLESEVRLLSNIHFGWRELYSLVTWKGKNLDAVQYQTQMNELLSTYKMSGMSTPNALNTFREIANSTRAKIKAIFSKYPITASLTNSLEIKSYKGKVSIQVKNLSKFIYLLGTLAGTIEENVKAEKEGKLSRALMDKNTQYKQAVIKSIGNISTGITALENELLSSSALKSNQNQIKGLSELTNLAESQAKSGEFKKSGDTLLQLTEKLTDTLELLANL